MWSGVSISLLASRLLLLAPHARLTKTAENFRSVSPESGPEASPSLLGKCQCPGVAGRVPGEFREWGGPVSRVANNIAEHAKPGLATYVVTSGHSLGASSWGAYCRSAIRRRNRPPRLGRNRRLLLRRNSLARSGRAPANIDEFSMPSLLPSLRRKCLCVCVPRVFASSACPERKPRECPSCSE